MKLRLNIIAIIACLPIMVSCEKDITEKFEDSQQNVFILSGELSAFEHPTINLTRSITMAQLDTLQYLNNAQVEIRSGDQSYQMEPGGYGNYTSSELLLQPGQEYHIHCSGEELPDASASVVIPVLPVVSEITLTVGDSLDLHLDIAIDDPATFRDYYTFYISGWLMEIHVHHDETGIETRDTLNVFTNYHLNIQDSVFEYSGNLQRFQIIEEESRYLSMVHFSDRLFNGSTHHLTVNSFLWSFYNDSIPEINIHLVKHDEHYFNFLESMTRYDPYNDLPIIQPVQIYSNIEGGFGLLTSRSHFTRTIDMSEWYYDPALLELFAK